MTRDTRIERGPLALGLWLMTVGVILALARLDLVEIHDVAPWWPLVVVAAGIGVATLGGAGESRRNGVWISLVGCWLLVNTLELGGFRWWSSWPLMVMMVGALQLVWPTADRDRAGGFITLAIGGWLLISVHGWFGLGWGTSWPILLVLMGAGMVIKAFARATNVARRTS
jgi:hypothetical protein